MPDLDFFVSAHPLLARQPLSLRTLARFGTGQSYVNFTSEGDEDKARASYPAETHARLAAVKAHYDPGNRFRFNQNIRPAQAR